MVAFGTDFPPRDPREAAPGSAAVGSESALALLHDVKDPEVPVIDIVELGIVRGVDVDGDRVTVRITPTYSGCPAMRVIEDEVESTLSRHGFREVVVKTVFNPPWTTDWITPEAKEKLRAYGIAPPGPAAEVELVQIGGTVRAVPCPFCGSANTRLESEFGATSCKAIHVCNNCHQPFEQFKAI
jgi:ring-1,2-phenylacetyl-CoA epoxidase subunit PaaD